jgi:hypothetical protein
LGRDGPEFPLLSLKIKNVKKKKKLWFAQTYSTVWCGQSVADTKNRLTLNCIGICTGGLIEKKKTVEL